MQFPHFTVPYLGDGMVIGLNAVVHMILSHGFAIGAFFMIAVAELVGYRSRNTLWEEFGRYAITPVVIIIGSASAVTGVGIWFTIGPLVPRASASMLRIFFWPWFIEWVVFVMEAVVLLVYYFLWDRMSEKPGLKKLHIGLGFSYTVLALASAVLIVGIIGFMLTPDGWPWSGSRLQAYFNPSLVPQTFLRLFGGMALGVPITFIFLFLFPNGTPEFRTRAIRLYGGIFLVAAALTAVFTWWYFAIVPATYKSHALFAVLSSKFSQTPSLFWIVNAIAIAVLLLFGLVALLGSRIGTLVLVIPALLLSFGLLAEFERIREFIRGPYLMPGYMWASQTLLQETPYINLHGSLSNSYWFARQAPHATAAQKAQFVFAQNCSTCHTIGGINDIRDRVKGRPVEAIAVILAHTHEMVPFMPMFAGTDEERQILADYLYRITNNPPGTPFDRFPALRGEARR